LDFFGLTLNNGFDARNLDPIPFHLVGLAWASGFFNVLRCVVKRFFVMLFIPDANVQIMKISVFEKDFDKHQTIAAIMQIMLPGEIVDVLDGAFPGRELRVEMLQDFFGHVKGRAIFRRDPML
jgi:hypothetical protein